MATGAVSRTVLRLSFSLYDMAKGSLVARDGDPTFGQLGTMVLSVSAEQVLDLLS